MPGGQADADTIRTCHWEINGIVYIDYKMNENLKKGTYAWKLLPCIYHATDKENWLDLLYGLKQVGTICVPPSWMQTTQGFFCLGQTIAVWIHVQYIMWIGHLAWVWVFGLDITSCAVLSWIEALIWNGIYSTPFPKLCHLTINIVTQSVILPRV